MLLLLLLAGEARGWDNPKWQWEVRYVGNLYVGNIRALEYVAVTATPIWPSWNMQPSQGKLKKTDLI